MDLGGLGEAQRPLLVEMGPPAARPVGGSWSHPQWTLSRHKAHSGASPAPGMWEANEIDPQIFKDRFSEHFFG